MDDNEIRLVKEGQYWIAEYHGAHAKHTEEVMGTNRLPTPFLSTEEGYIVADHVRAQNPGVKVVVG